MNGEYHDPRIRIVELREIDPKGVVAVLEACIGAMGDSGAFELYSIQHGEVLYFYGNADYEDLDLLVAKNYLPDGVFFDDSFCLRWDKDNWAMFGGGMGNTFLIKQAYYQELRARCMRCVSDNYYRSWVPVLQELLVEIATDAPRNMDIGENNTGLEHRPKEEQLERFILDFMKHFWYPEKLSMSDFYHCRGYYLRSKAGTASYEEFLNAWNKLLMEKQEKAKQDELHRKTSTINCSFARSTSINGINRNQVSGTEKGNGVLIDGKNLVGAKVRHKKFGEGEITDAGSRGIITVRFDSGRTHVLLLDYALRQNIIEIITN